MTSEQAKEFCKGFGVEKLEGLAGMLGLGDDWSGIGERIRDYFNSTLKARKTADSLVIKLATTILQMVREEPKVARVLGAGKLEGLELIALIAKAERKAVEGITPEQLKVVEEHDCANCPVADGCPARAASVGN